MIRTINLVLLALSTLFTVSSSLAAQTALACQPGSSPQFGSGWCDFASPVDLKHGDRLKLAIGGSASKIIVRLLPKGADPTTPIGVIPTPLSVPASRFVELTVPHDALMTSQISVHGGPNPWGQHSLGAGNGPATITGVERLTAQSSPQQP